MFNPARGMDKMRKHIQGACHDIAYNFFTHPAGYLEKSTK